MKWGILASPNDKFDPDIVREFYANAFPIEGSGEPIEHKSWVRGRTVHYDRDTINTLLGAPYERREGFLDHFHTMLNEPTSRGFSNLEVAELLCIQGRTFDTNPEGYPRRIRRKYMTTMAQIWMTFLIHNVIPKSHVSTLPMDDCCLIFSILDDITIDIAQVISNEIFKTATRSGKKGTLGFPSLITTLCESQGVQVNRTESIKPPITNQYIQLNCKEEAISVPPQHQAPPQPPEQQPLSLEQKIDRLTIHMEHVELQNNMLRQGQLHQQQGLYHSYQLQYPDNLIWLSPEDFAERFPWPGDRPTFPEGAGADGPSAAGAEDGDEESDDSDAEDDEMDN